MENLHQNNGFKNNNSNVLGLNISNTHYSLASKEPIRHIHIQHHTKQSFFSNIWTFIQFILISTTVFISLFLILNWQAYALLLDDYLHPDSFKPKEIALNNALTEPVRAQNLLKLHDKQKKSIKKNIPTLNLNITPPDNRIIIPKIGKNIPIVSIDNYKYNSIEKLAGKEFEGAIQDGLQNGVVHYPGTAFPNQYGNFFVTGHSSYYPWDAGRYKDVFALLEKLEIGDIYYIYFNQKKYTYKIFEKKEVSAKNIEVLEQPTDNKIGTLMTCTPVGTDLRRLIIQAEQI